MSSSRRQFLKHLAGGAAVTAAGSSFARAASAANYTLSGNASQPKHYSYLGRTEDYKEWAVVPRGLTVKKIETFRREMLALVRVTASDGSVGWGQIAPYEANLSAGVLHQLVARRVLGRDISDVNQ